MLLVHGFPELWYSWRWQLQAFKDDYEVVAFDLRGYGLTEKPKVVSCMPYPVAATVVLCFDCLVLRVCCIVA